MISDFYRAHSKAILLMLALTFPLLALYAESIPSNNDIETWLPAQTQVRETYEYFRRHFGAEDVVLIGLSGDALADNMPDILSRRVARLPRSPLASSNCCGDLRRRCTLRPPAGSGGNARTC